MSTEIPNDISLNGLNVTRSEEGRALRAYQDSVGVWTVGYGLTNFDKNLPWKVERDLTITEEQAEWYLLRSIRDNYLPACRRALEGGTYAHPQGALDGSADFHFNTGGIGKATWPAALGRGDLAAAQASMMSWNKAGGNVLSGLTRRRARNWGEVSAESYGHISGPSVIEPNADWRERVAGTGDILTAFPRDPGDKSAGNVKRDGIPQPTTEAPGVLMLGSTGPAVKELQNSLSAVGYPTRVTGVFDDQTAANVLAFQRAHPNLTADGMVGPATRATLGRALAMRSATRKITKTLPTIPAAYIGFHQWLSEHAGNIALGIGLIAFVAVAGFFVVRYRDEVTAHINGLVGRQVV